MYQQPIPRSFETDFSNAFNTLRLSIRALRDNPGDNAILLAAGRASHDYLALIFDDEEGQDDAALSDAAPTLPPGFDPRARPILAKHWFGVIALPVPNGSDEIRAAEENEAA